jgi:hypothetical protein
MNDSSLYLRKKVRPWKLGPNQPGIEAHKEFSTATPPTLMTRYRPRPTGNLWWDHSYVYTNKEGETCYCTEPYWLSSETLLMLGTLAVHGWKVSIGGISRHGFGTLHVEIMEKS